MTNDQLVELLDRELARHPQVAGECLARFAVLSEVRRVIRASAPRIAGWMQAEVGSQRVANVVDQFITYCRNEAASAALRAQVAGAQAIESIQRTLTIKIAEGHSGEELLRVVEAACDGAHTGFLATMDPEGERFIGGVKKVAESVKDTSAVVLENMALQCARILESAGVLHADAERDS